MIFRGDTVPPATLDLLDDLGLGERFAVPHSRGTEVLLPDARDGLLCLGDAAHAMSPVGGGSGSAVRCAGWRPEVAVVSGWGGRSRCGVR
ncbi:hypothetical protein CF165_42330 [Amycolatopsis vastitatis]|uniref:FAD-binding domain-containing protein n=1 Tax=Amycolatopsis vastitatis TaxID=1905142 RepID=A0A229SN66_9PSEU|nr:hypothetical protein CF165_42330 [Amycolatopsis vastitatis]